MRSAEQERRLREEEEPSCCASLCACLCCDDDDEETDRMANYQCMPTDVRSGHETQPRDVPRRAATQIGHEPPPAETMPMEAAAAVVSLSPADAALYFGKSANTPPLLPLSGGCSITNAVGENQDHTESRSLLEASAGSSSMAGGLPRTTSDTLDTTKTCCICYEPFTMENPHTHTVCVHKFHLPCIDDWNIRSLERGTMPLCPVCDTPLQYSR